MLVTKQYDTVVIGAGAAGMAAAVAVCEQGFRVAVLDREDHVGGILVQCIHNGFGLHHFKQELTGPEYADEYAQKIAALPIDMYLETTAVDIRSENGLTSVAAYSGMHGVLDLKAKTVVLAMGCRERNRGNIGIPGARPSGIFTAGLAQRLLNIDGCIPGKRVVIVGSGDIGLIMARRLTWVGSKVLAVVEILPYPSGLTRNIVQCLQDFSIPLHLGHAVTRIIGADRVEGVEISPLLNGVPDTSRRFLLDCDTVLLSVGLIPENELSRKAGVEISPNTNGPVVDYNLQTNIDGIFACGNVLHVHDLVDFVSEEAQRCGQNVAAYLGENKAKTESGVTVVAGANLKYVLPNTVSIGKESRFLMRAMVVLDKAELTVRQGATTIRQQALKRVRPAEMISLVLNKEESGEIAAGAPVEFSIST